jgi:hypothetical protein
MTISVYFRTSGVFKISLREKIKLKLSVPKGSEFYFLLLERSAMNEKNHNYNHIKIAKNKRWVKRGDISP